MRIYAFARAERSNEDETAAAPQFSNMLLLATASTQANCSKDLIKGTPVAVTGAGR